MKGCVGIPGEDESWDFGSGAGFYLDATREPWSRNYQMYSYITQELLGLIYAQMPFLVGSRMILE